MIKPASTAHVTHEIASGPRRARRAQPRAHVELHARISSETGGFDGTVRDIGLGGLFIETASVPAYGQRVEVELALDAHGPSFRMAAIVRWTNDEGFGAQLQELDARATHAIACLVQAARQAEAADL